jgi:GT2 family glycosyltransferase
VSVVVCTHGDRQASLQRLLAALAWQTVPFELVVVLGPGSAALRALVESLPPETRRVACDRLNISRARNTGIAASGGDIIVFVDDDAVPMGRDWLEHLTARLGEGHDPQVAAVGSTVYRGDSDFVEFAGGATSGTAFQRFGEEDGEACAPDGTRWIARVPGGNCAIARGPLEEVGGFDEQFAYYLDETDLCTRLDAAGYRILYTREAPIRHFAVSSAHGRPGQRHRFPVARSDAYFVLRHAGGRAARRAWSAIRAHPAKHFVREGRCLFDLGGLTRAGLMRFRLQCSAGLAAGIWAGLWQRPVLPLKARDTRPAPWQRFAGRRALVVDPGPDALSDERAPHVLRAVAESLQRMELGTSVTVLSGRLTLEATGPYCLAAPPSSEELVELGEDPVEPLVESFIAPGLEIRAGEARRPMAALQRAGVLAGLDHLAWLGSPDLAAFFAVAGLSVTSIDTSTSPITWSLVAGPAPSAETPRAREAGVPSTLDLTVAALRAQLMMDAPLPDTAVLVPRHLAPSAALERLGLSLRRGRPDLALLLCEAVRRHPATSPAQVVAVDYYVAHALRLLGRGREAAAWYESIRQRGRDVGAEPAYLAGACYHLALEAQSRGESPRALLLLRECLDHVPAHAAARHLLEQIDAGSGLAA